MTERVRILNPTCDTCRWYRTKNLDLGDCHLNPTVMLPDKFGLGYATWSVVHMYDFCSHHESAFDDQQWNQKRADMIKRHNPKLVSYKSAI